MYKYYQYFFVFLMYLNAVKMIRICIRSDTRNSISIFHYKNKPEWITMYNTLEKQAFNTSQACRFNMKLEYHDQLVYVTFQFDSTNNETIQNQDKISLQIIIPANSRSTIEIEFELICVNNLCTRDYFNNFVQNDLFHKLFTLYISLMQIQSLFIKLLVRDWFNISPDEYEDDDNIIDYDRDEFLCYDKVDDDKAILCTDNICSTYLLPDKQLFSCGFQYMQYQYKTHVVVILTRITSDMPEIPYLEMKYTCNKNHCNGRKKAIEIMKIINGSYNIVEWLKQYNIFSYKTSTILSFEQYTETSMTDNISTSILTSTFLTTTKYTSENIASDQHYHRLLTWIMICALFFDT